MFKQEDNINDITLNPLIQEAVRGNEEALDSLIMHPEMSRILDDVSAWAEWMFRQPKDIVKQELLLKLWAKLDTIRDHNRLAPWLYTIAKHYCLNEIQHERLETARHDKIMDQSREATRLGGKPLVQSTPELTPEQVLLQIEQEEEEDRVRRERLERLRKAITPFPKWLVEGWSLGKTPKEMAQETGVPLSTIYRNLKNMQKAIIKEFGV